MKHILVVDDNKANLAAARDELAEEYIVTPVISGMQALKFLERKSPDLILLDINMPHMDGKETLAKIRTAEGEKHIPVIFLTADGSAETEAECLELGAEDFIAKPFIPTVMKSRIARTLELDELKCSLRSQLEAKSAETENLVLKALSAIAGASERREKYAAGHADETAYCADMIAAKMGLEPSFRRSLHFAALLCDIGKISVPEAILNKSGTLAPEEFEAIKKHAVSGGELLKDISFIGNIAEAALYHHERYDGKGYPDGLYGENIPLAARIIAAADAFSAMKSERVYRPALSTGEMLKEFEKGSGTQFDPEIAEIMTQLINSGLESGNNSLFNRILEDNSAEIRTRSDKDALTGLYNRMYTAARTDEILRKGGNGALIIFNADDFGEINNKAGHLAGDSVLRTVADAVSRCCDKGDIACRIGGDNFVIFTPCKKSDSDLASKAEKFTDEILYSADELSGVSVGISVFPRDGGNFSELYSSADKALYFSKRSGKGCCSFYSSEKDFEPEISSAADFDTVEQIINGKADGIFNVDYENFRQIYSFLSRCVKRRGEVIQTVLFTINGAVVGLKTDEAEAALAALERTASLSLRAVDVGAKFGSSQYIVLLTYTDIENGRRVAERVISGFEHICPIKNARVKYEIRTMLPH